MLAGSLVECDDEPNVFRHRPPVLNRGQRSSTGTHLAVSLLSGLVAGGTASRWNSWLTSALIAWVAASLVWLLWTWTALWPLDPSATAHLAKREDPSRVLRDLVLLFVAVGALLTVVLVVFHAHQSGLVRTLLGVACIAASWAVVHTIFTLRYARLYYVDPPGGLDFKQEPDPSYRDFAYVAFTVGMTFQVADTDIQKASIRATVLRHALLSFLFATVIIGVTVNLVAGLSK